MYNKKNLDAFNLNMSTVLEFIYRNPQTSRIEIAHSTGITPATITSIVGELLDKNLIIETGAEVQGALGSGRKRKVLILNPSAGFFLGIEFNMKGLFLSVTDACGNVVYNLKKELNDFNVTHINQLIIDMINTACETLDTSKIIGAGIAIPGHFDSINKSIISNNKMWKDFSLSKINKNFNFPIIAENNIECMALGEYLFNPLKTPEKFLFLHVGPGLFCSFFNSNHIGFKSNFYLGEIGHTVVDINGPKCECGKNGCLQTYISESWLIKNAKYLFENSTNTVLHSLVETSDEINIKTIIDAYKLNDPYFKERIVLGIKLLGTSIANTLIMQDADKIYLNSELFTNDEFRTFILEIIENQLMFIPTKRNVDIEIENFNYNRGATGACALACLSFVIKNTGYLQE